MKKTPKELARAAENRARIKREVDASMKAYRSAPPKPVDPRVTAQADDLQIEIAIAKVSRRVKDAEQLKRAFHAGPKLAPKK